MTAIALLCAFISQLIFLFDVIPSVFAQIGSAAETFYFHKANGDQTTYLAEIFKPAPSTLHAAKAYALIELEPDTRAIQRWGKDDHPPTTGEIFKTGFIKKIMAVIESSKIPNIARIFSVGTTESLTEFSPSEKYWNASGMIKYT